MVRIVHIARIRTAATERRVAAMAAHAEFSFRLVRPTGSPGNSDGLDAVRDPSRFDQVRLARMWRVADPHRGVYLTPAFGLRSSAADIVHAEEEPDGMAALHVAAARRVLAPRARLVLFTWQNVNRPKGPAVEWVTRRTLAAADAVICGNRGAASVLRNLGYQGPTPVIPALSLDTSTFRRRPAPRFGDAFTVAYVGRLAPEKGVDTLVSAVAAAGPPALLVVAGSGPCRDTLELQARELGIGASVRFAGPLDPRGVAGLLCGVDALAVPSRSTPVWQEQFGRVIVEAMGCGVPVVASSSGAIPEVMDGHGLFFGEGDVATLADHLRRLRASAPLRDELGRGGLEYALRAHETSVRARQVIDFYRELGARPLDGGR